MEPADPTPPTPEPDPEPETPPDPEPDPIPEPEPTPVYNGLEHYVHKSIPLSANTSSTTVWTVSNAWNDRDTPAARLAGLAWPANSGLSWEQKYERWIKQLQATDSADPNYRFRTFVITNPRGKSLPIPRLECAELAMFLRITFAAWHKLPFFMQGWGKTSSGTWVKTYLGHFGWRTSSGAAFESGRNFANYSDYSDWSPNQIAQNGWPKDNTLRGLKLGDDDSVGDFGAPFKDGDRIGAYFDELFLNKRVGYYLRLVLLYHGSAHLILDGNTYNIKPETIRPGDLVLERWQSSGVGHTLLVKRVTRVAEDGLDRLSVELASGNMPRRQAKWENSSAAAYYLTHKYTGGYQTDPDENKTYAKMGGGLKRWLVARKHNGNWVNTLADSDVPSYIPFDDLATIGARPGQFETLLATLSPEQQLQSLLENIEAQRQHLRNYPASCSARRNREFYFDQLYELTATYSGLSKAETDAQYRILDDYVFAELEYEKSKTCCWNTTTSVMYSVIMDLNVKRVLQSGVCQEPLVFMAQNGGYLLFKQHAQLLGKTWVNWSEDESCPQRNVSNDTLVPISSERPGACQIADQL